MSSKMVQLRDGNDYIYPAMERIDSPLGTDYLSAIQAEIDELPNDLRVHIFTVIKGTVSCVICQKQQDINYAAAIVFRAGYTAITFLNKTPSSGWTTQTVQFT